MRWFAGLPMRVRKLGHQTQSLRVIRANHVFVRAWVARMLGTSLRSMVVIEYRQNDIALFKLLPIV
jgi:hypothetical protein